MQATINTGMLSSLEWGASGEKRVLQNIQNLLSMSRYEVAYDRTLGLSPELLDRPSKELAGQYVSEITDLIEDNEPRATVVSVNFLRMLDNGQMDFEVVVEVSG